MTTRCNEGGRVDARGPILFSFFLQPLLLVPAEPLFLFPFQPPRQPLLVLFKGVPENLDVFQNDRLEGSVCCWVDRDALELRENLLYSDDTSEDSVLACRKCYRGSETERNGIRIARGCKLTVKVRALFAEGQEELTSVRIRAAVGHRQCTSLIMFNYHTRQRLSMLAWRRK